MRMPSARATTRHRHAEHTVVRAVSAAAATTAGQVTARRPFSNGAAPTSRTRKPSTVTPAVRRSRNGPNRRTARPNPTATEFMDATRGYTGPLDTLFNGQPWQRGGPAAGRVLR